MNHVWSPIALMSAPCAVRTHREPLLRLFNGYAKSLSRSPRRFAPSTWNCQQPWSPKYAFSTTTYLPAQRTNRNRKPPSQPSRRGSREPNSNSKLEPAPTVASHTEGLPPKDEPLTWRDYDPVGGMPLPNDELSQPQIYAVFNSEEVDVDTGNYVLSVMHWRRLSGALIDVGLDFPKESGVTQEMALRGLQYVRSIMPDVDEAATGQQWAEEESQRLQEEIQARAVKLGVYQKVEEEESVPEEEQQGTEYGRERTGQSVLQATRKANEAAWEAEKAARAAAAQAAEVASIHTTRGPLELGAGVQPITASGQNATLARTTSRDVSIRPPPPNAWLQPVERKPWVKYYEEQATIIKENVIPQLSNTRRLAPAFLVFLLVLSGCYYLSNNYTPPPTSARLWPDVPPSVATLSALTLVLAAGFLLGRLPPMWRTWNKYFVLAPAYPFAASIMGALFRHDTAWHLVSNVISLWLFGLMLHEDVGRGTFLAIYFASGVLGSYGGLVYYVLRRKWTAYVFGSSGCITGVAAAAVVLRPNAKIKIAGYEIPIAAWVFVALFAGAEALAVLRGAITTIDHAGHVGGMLMGAGSALAIRASRREARLKSASIVQKVA